MHEVSYGFAARFIPEIGKSPFTWGTDTFYAVYSMGRPSQLQEYKNSALLVCFFSA